MICQQNHRKFNKITVENVNEKLKKVFTMFTKSAKNVCTIYSENYKETVQNVCLFVCLFFFFNKITMEGKQENANPKKMCAKVNKMFVNVPKQSTRLKSLSILF